MKTSLAAAFAIVTLTSTLLGAAPSGTSAPSAATAALAELSCSVRDLSLAVSGDPARFDGMSHAGTTLVIRNTSTQACSIPALPKIVARDAAGKTVAIGTPPGARFMHPGPVVLPITLAPQENASATIRWVSSNVFDRGAKAEVVSLSLQIRDETIVVPLAATMWGENDTITFVQNRLR